MTIHLSWIDHLLKAAILQWDGLTQRAPASSALGYFPARGEECRVVTAPTVESERG
jgi:hypothetical protein